MKESEMMAMRYLIWWEGVMLSQHRVSISNTKS